MIRFTDTLRNWWHEFLNYFDDRVTQGFVEGINRAIRDIINHAPLTFPQLCTKLTSETHCRVGSLLEACLERGRRVDTGFHPTPLCSPAGRGMTGRENIYLSGAIPSTGSGQAAGSGQAWG